MSELFMGFRSWFPLVPPWEFARYPQPSAELYRDEYNALWCSGPILDSSIDSYDVKCTTDATVCSTLFLRTPSSPSCLLSPPPWWPPNGKCNKVKWQLLRYNKSSWLLLKLNLFLHLKPSKPHGHLWRIVSSKRNAFQVNWNLSPIHGLRNPSKSSFAERGFQSYRESKWDHSEINVYWLRCFSIALPSENLWPSWFVLSAVG